MSLRRSPATLLLLALASCGTSPKTNFYTLNMIPAATERPAIAFPVQLAAVHLPPSLDRREMVRLSGENHVEIMETDRWSAPLDEMVRNVLSQDLAARLPDGTVILPQAPAPQGTATLVVTMAQFGPDAGGSVRLDGSWSLLPPGATVPTIQRDVRISTGPATTANGTAAAMSRALSELADDIAAGLAPAGARAARNR